MLAPFPDDDEVAAAVAAEAAAHDAARAALADLPDDALAAYHDTAWSDRRAATDRAAAATIEMLARRIAAEFPTAARFTLVEDTSHGAPHGHLCSILDASGAVLADALSDAWHDRDGVSDIDDLAWYLHHLVPDRFAHIPGQARRALDLPVRA